MLSPLKISVIAILLFVLTAALHKRCCIRLRNRTRNRNRGTLAERRFRRRHRARGFFRRLLFGGYYRDEEDYDEDEKTRLMGGVGARGGDGVDAEMDAKYENSCALERTNTVAQEIASFRIAADVVSEMVAAEEGRVQVRVEQHQQQQQQRQVQQGQQRETTTVVHDVQHLRAVAAHMPPPLSPDAAFAHYMAGLEDEALPAYEYVHGEGSDSGSMVTDGFSDYTPGSVGSGAGSGVPPTGADDVLGDTKH